MDTNRIKRFATEARNKLKEGIAAKIRTLGFDKRGNVAEEHRPQLMQGGTHWNGQLLPETFYHQWTSLYNRIQQKGISEVYEEAAYTWFNRLCAIRILQKNDLCAPVLDYTDAARTPFIVDEARQGRLPEMNDEMRSRLSDLLDDDTKVTEQFAVLINAWCHDNPIIHSCFGAMADYTELLLPNNILIEGGFVDMLNRLSSESNDEHAQSLPSREGGRSTVNHTDFITDADYRSPELIGWLYQFYISERKDEVFAKKGKFEADEIPAATQIFTPNWIVKYMVQNTVGRIYLDNNPYEMQLQKKWQYLVEPSEKPSADSILKYDELTDLRVADLACGSGHILNECFDLLYDLYIAEGYGRGEAIENIFRHNLTGVDLDTRAKQLATFALLLKACQKDNAFADAHCLPKVLDMPERVVSLNRFFGVFMHDMGSHSSTLLEAVELCNQSHDLGSIMKFDITEQDRKDLAFCIERWEQEHETHELNHNANDVAIAKLILALTDKYHALVMNPPYMGAGHMDDSLLTYVKYSYPLTSNDLGAVFMDVAHDSLLPYGKFAMINQAAWFFKPAYKLYRESVIDSNTYNLESALYLGPNTFPELKGEVVQSVAFVASKGKKNTTAFFYLKKGETSEVKSNLFCQQDCNIYYKSISDFSNFAGSQFGFWINNDIQKTFKESSISKYGDSKQGLKTGNNAYFIRNWFEVSKNKIGMKWFPVETGGNFRKWYGNGITVLNWENDGEEIKNYKDDNGRLRSRPQGLQYAFTKGITWSTSAGDNPSFRISDERFLFESSGSKFFLNEGTDRLNLFCAYFNSYVAKSFIEMFSPGLGISEGAIKSLPFLEDSNISEAKSSQNISISKQDWDAHETSWDFEENPLLAVDEETYIDNIHHVIERHEKETGERICIDPAAPELDSLEWRMEQYKQKWEHLFMQLHENEEELNRQFIDIYGLQDELTPDVPLDEITILQQGEVTFNL